MGYLERYNRAKELAYQFPEWGRRRINAQLRSEYGHGLRDATIDNISQTMGRPTVLTRRLITRDVFTNEEKQVLKDAIKRGNPPYIRDAIEHRWWLFHQLVTIPGRDTKSKRARRAQLREFRASRKREYKERGWLVKKTTFDKEKNPNGRIKGQFDPWAMLKYFRDRLIADGDYTPTFRAKPKTDKQAVKDQKATWQESQQNRAIKRIQEQINELERMKKESKGERREQLQWHIRQLQRDLR